MKNSKQNNFNLASRTKGALNDKWQARIITLESIINKKLKTINGLIFRNKGRGLIGLNLKLIRAIRPRLSKSVVKQVAVFSFSCYRIAKHSGLKGLVLYLKACQVLLQQVVGGYRVIDLSELKVRPSRNRSGVPLIIPAGARVMISRDRNISQIKLWMTLLGLYRILSFRGKLTLDSITDKGPDLSSFIPEWEDFLTKHFKPGIEDFIKLPSLNGPDLFPILKSGPTSGNLESDRISYTNSSAKSLVLSARVWLHRSNSQLITALKVFLQGIPNSATFISRLQTVSMVVHKYLDDMLGTEDRFSLGRLGLKIEPAGKIRVFAMVDAWTQWLMYPLHDWLFKILFKIPQDGTFDQMNPIIKLQKKYADNPKGLFSSIDLSSATDRLPISLQVSLLKVLLKDIVPDSESFSQAWADLLVKRRYEVPVKKGTKVPFDLPEEIESHVTYSVGQPMGALSSWAMLALTHHAMMQYSSFKCGGKGWFTAYAVLGDDGVIKGTNQTNAYRSLLAKIGVKAGLAKSILARNKFVIEFAKKFFVDKTTANMLPYKESVATWASTSLVVEFVRKYDLTLNQILSFLGYGYKAKMRVFKTSYFKLPTRLRVLLVWLSHPSSPLGEKYYVDWLSHRSWSEFFEPTEECAEKVLANLIDANSKKLDRISEVFDKYISSISNVDKVMDKLYPINIITQGSSSQEFSYNTVLIPWKAVLSPELHSEDIDYDYLSAWNDGGMSQHGYRFQVLNNLKIGVDIDKLIDDFNDRRQNIDFIDDPVQSLWVEEHPGQYDELDIMDRIDNECRYHFQLDDLGSIIPEEFWANYRKSEQPFRDFLSIYKFWQDMTKPFWSESYGVSFKDISKTEIPHKRGVKKEGSVKHNSPSGFLFKFPWVDFWIGFTLSIMILSWIYSPSEKSDADIPFIYDIISSVSEIDVPLQVVTDPVNRPDGNNVLLLTLLGTGVTLLFGSIFISYMLGSPWAWLGIYEEEVPLNGPLSIEQLGLLQVELENRALLDNLAISPIGDLWIDPW